MTCLDAIEHITIRKFNELLEVAHSLTVIHELQLHFEALEERKPADLEETVRVVEFFSDLLVVALDVGREIGELSEVEGVIDEEALVVEHVLPDQLQHLLGFLVHADPAVYLGQGQLVPEQHHQVFEVELVVADPVDLCYICLYFLLEEDFEDLSQ